MNAVKKGMSVNLLETKKKKKRPAKRRIDKGVIEHKYGPDKGRKHEPDNKKKRFPVPEWLKERMGVI